MGSGEWDLHGGTSVLNRKRHRVLSLSFSHVRTQYERRCVQARKSSHQDPSWPAHELPELQNQLLLFKQLSLLYYIIAAQVD